MAFKIVTLACLLAVAHAGVIAPVAHYSAPSHYAAAPVAHYAAAPVAHYAAAPVAHYAAAPVAHYAAAPVAHYAAPAKVAYAAPVAHYAPAKVAYAAPEEHYAPAEYSFEYSVHDEHTGDIKSQHETRHGDQVQGSYSLVEADGSKRTVEYTADEHSGFNAVVHREASAHPVAVKPVLKVAAPVAVHGYAAPAPAYHSYAAPAPAYHSYAAPAIQTYAHAAPSHSYYHH